MFYYIFQYIKNSIHDFLYHAYFYAKWKKRNKHNRTTSNGGFRIERVSVGSKSYGEIHLLDCSPENVMVKIGNYVSIAPDVTFILGGEHNTRTISTYPFKVLAFGQNFEAGTKGDIVVQDDVWIGMNTTICSGVTIGQGAVVAAGAVVTKDIPPYSIAAGVPAKVIKSRFSDALKEKLVNTDVNKLFSKFTKEDLEQIYSTNEDDITALLQKYGE